MNVRMIAGLWLILSSTLVVGRPSYSHASDELVVLTYDSIASPQGLGGVLIPEFEKVCRCKVKLISTGDAGTLATRLELEARRGANSADIVWGFDEILWPRVRPHVQAVRFQAPVPYIAEVQSLVSQEIQEGFVPFDYGIFAWMVDTQAKGVSPNTLQELETPAFNKKFLLQDPRTSTPGLAFLRFTQKQFPNPERWSVHWSKLSQQWLTLAPGWDQAYALFLKGEAPLVWSYTTSEAYHRMHGDSKMRYRAAIFKEAMPVQVEGAALLKRSRQSELGTRFLEFLVSEQAQRRVPEGNWMLPVRKGVKVPKSFEGLPRPKKWISLKGTAEELKDLLAQWSRAVHTTGHR